MEYTYGTIKTRPIESYHKNQKTELQPPKSLTRIIRYRQNDSSMESRFKKTKTNLIKPYNYHLKRKLQF